MSAARESKPHLLYIAYAYPPSTASSVYRGVAVPNAFIAAGWDVTVLTIDGETWSEISGLDTELLDSVDPAVRVVRVSDGGAEDQARGDLRKYSKLRVEAPYVWQHLRSRRSRQFFPETPHGLWLEPASSAVRDTHRERPVDLIIGSASPYVTFAIARSLSGVPYVMDYRDAWAFNTITGRENFPVESTMGGTESVFLDEALQVWFVNDAIQEEYARRYPGAAAKMRVVPNGFDPQPGHAPRLVTASARPSFGYLGTLQHQNNPLEEFLDGWVDAFGLSDSRNLPAATAQIRGKLSSSGSVSAELLKRLDGLRQHGLKFTGPVPKRQVAHFYGTLDALILLLASGKYVTGGKTAEYLATGLPIVSIHDLDNAATDLLRDYPLWFPARELTPTAISAALRECADAIRHPDTARWQAAWDYGQSFLRTTLMAPVIEELTEAITASHHQSGPLPADRVASAASAVRSAHPVQPDVANNGGELRGEGDARQVHVVVIMSEESPEVLEDLRARITSVGGSTVSLVAFVADGQVGSAQNTIRVSEAGRAEQWLQRIAVVGGYAGVVGRLLQDNARSRRLARAVLRNRELMAEICIADVVMAADFGATRAVWQLRSRTQADLVRGSVALIHVLRRRWLP